jgi:SET domain-containing protein
LLCQFKQKIEKEILHEIVVKLAPSKIANAGVGVFALTSIEKGEIVFRPDKNEFIEWQNLKGLESNIFSHIKSICNHNDYGFWIDCSINKVNASYYVNHSDEPNLYHDLETDVFCAIKNIQIGEELTCKYLPKEIDWV